MSKITKHAKGQECQIRLFPYCNQNTETTVFCHANSEDKGFSYKSPDWWGAFGCSTCHDIVDNRQSVDIEKNEIQACFVRAIYRTLKILINDGLIEIK